MKENIMKIAMIITLLVSMTSLLAREVSPRDRFQLLLDNIDEAIKVTIGDQNRIDALSSGKLRGNLFKIQTLADMYTTRYSSLRDVFIATKRLEDNIGGFRKSREEYQYAQGRSDSATITRLKRNMDRQRDSLRQFMVSSGWIKSNGRKLKELTILMDSITWDNPKQDRAYVYGKLAERLENTDRKNWDMFRLEGGGIHDLRKAARWYRLESGAMTDIISTGASCNQGGQVTLGRCNISSCLHSEMDDLYSHFGDIKDEGEGRHAIGEELPHSYFVQANDRYQRLKKQDVFAKLAKEYKACLK
jgi:hypothetical protein